MPTTSTPKPDSEKKNVRVKWRDHEWYPRIIIRSANRRVSAYGDWQCVPQATGMRRLQKVRVHVAGSKIPGAGRCASVTNGFVSRTRLINLPGSESTL